MAQRSPRPWPPRRGRWPVCRHRRRPRGIHGGHVAGAVLGRELVAPRQARGLDPGRGQEWVEPLGPERRIHEQGGGAPEGHPGRADVLGHQGDHAQLAPGEVRVMAAKEPS